MITRADLVAVATTQHRRLYAETGNGLHVWAAYVQTRRLRGAPPAWVLDYFDAAAARLLAPEGTRRPAAVAAALALETSGGGPAAHARAVAAKRAGAIRQNVAAYRQALGLTRTAAIERAADETGLSVERVTRILSERPKTRR